MKMRKIRRCESCSEVIGWDSRRCPACGKYQYSKPHEEESTLDLAKDSESGDLAASQGANHLEGSLESARPCIYCKNPVAPNASTCPRCGGKHPFPMKPVNWKVLIIGGIILTIVMIIVCSDDSANPQRPQPQVGLMQKRMLDWRNASYENRLAASVDVITALKATGSVPSSSSGSIKTLAVELEACVSATGRGGGVTDNMEVAEISAACMILMHP